MRFVVCAVLWVFSTGAAFAECLPLEYEDRAQVSVNAGLITDFLICDAINSEGENQNSIEEMRSDLTEQALSGLPKLSTRETRTQAIKIVEDFSALVLRGLWKKMATAIDQRLAQSDLEVFARQVQAGEFDRAALNPKMRR